MDLSFELVEPAEPRAREEIDHLPDELEDFPTLVMVCCKILESAGYEFRISGFGSSDWNFDVGYDMSTLIEGIPDLVDGMNKAGSAEVDLYSQGIERTLEFRLNGREVLISCASHTSWRPDPPSITMDAGILQRMFADLAKDFSRAVLEPAPELADFEPLNRWRTGDIGYSA